MPSICQNAANWHADVTKSRWPLRWDGWFTYDVGTGGRITGRGQVRREQQCPSTWKGTIAMPRCPETNQPQVVPPLFDANGLPVTALAPQPPGATEVDLMIADGRDDPLVGSLQPSGRRYSCDEFPPASWIEAGIGWQGVNIPEGNGGRGTTICAPIGARCDLYDVRGSEQNWQGIVHKNLGATLEAMAVAEGLSVHPDQGIAFRFLYPTERDETWAARVSYKYVGQGLRWDGVHPGTHWDRRDAVPSSRVATHFFTTPNGSVFIQIPNGEVFRGNDLKTAHHAAKRAVELLYDRPSDETHVEKRYVAMRSRNDF
jgi:chitinase